MATQGGYPFDEASTEMTLLLFLMSVVPLQAPPLPSGLDTVRTLRVTAPVGRSLAVRNVIGDVTVEVGPGGATYSAVATLAYHNQWNGIVR